MAQLQVNLKKDVTIENLVCSANVIILAKQTTTTRNGEVSTSVRYIEVCKVGKTDSLAIVQTLLKYCIAEHFVCSDFENDFADTKIQQAKIFNKFLTTNTIYRTNSEGKITNALISEVPFSQTALKIKGVHTIVTCEKNNLKAAIYNHAKAILSQCNYLRLIIDKVGAIDKDIAKVEKTTVSKSVELKDVA